MNRRGFLKTTALGVAALAVPEVAPSRSAKPSGAKKPNILFLTTDEQRFDTYGVEHSDWPALPNLTRLRQESATLTNAYANCPICMPCRYTWLTGLYGSQTERGSANGYDWPDYHRTMPQALRKAGYHTALIGKLHAFNVGTLRRHHLNDLERHSHVWGFDTLYECSGRGIWSHGPKHVGRLEDYGINGCRYTDHLRRRGLYEKALRENIEREDSLKQHHGLEPYRPGVLDVEDTMDGFVIGEMRRFIRDYDRPEPFYLHASFFGPHYPLDVPERYFRLFRPEDMPPPVGESDPIAIRRWQENRAMYMGLATLVDELIGTLLTTLDEKGLRDNTVIVMSTDHGDMLGDHGLTHKYHPHEGSCRTPILVRAPGTVPAGVTLPGLAESADIPQTILDIAGLSAEERAAALPESPGLSFWDYCRQGGATFRDSALAETRNNGRMLRHGEWKYTRSNRGPEALYNLHQDPCERDNLANAGHADVLRDMQGRLIDRMAALRVPPLQGKFHGDDVMKAMKGAPAPTPGGISQ